MSLLLYNDCVFLHIPKTGGFWVNSILKSLGVIKERDSEHNNLSQLPADYKDKLKFTIVRNPYTWYQSYWCMHYERKMPLKICDKVYPLYDFNLFIGLFLKDQPNYLTRLYKSYMGDKFDKVQYIARFENLEAEFKMLLSAINIGWNDNVFKYTMKINRTYMAKPDYTPEMKELVYNQEKEIFDFFGYSKEL